MNSKLAMHYSCSCLVFLTRYMPFHRSRRLPSSAARRGPRHRRQRAAPSIINSAHGPRRCPPRAASASPQIARPSPRMVALPAFPAILAPHAPVCDAQQLVLLSSVRDPVHYSPRSPSASLHRDGCLPGAQG
jgi:hypothetical protein